jgi:hypothetical protein
MKSLDCYSILKTSVFYKGWHILEYLNTHELSLLDQEAIKATIMDALVTSGDIDYRLEYLDLKHMCILEDSSYYAYQKYPNICGIPLWMKELFRHKSLYITGGLPVSVFLSIPSKSRCIYDMNTAVSACFEHCNFYQVNYKSPTRIGEVALDRPFVEVEIDGVFYLVDTITRRMIRRDFFEKNYGFDIMSQFKKEELWGKRREIYDQQVEEKLDMSSYLYMYYLFEDNFRNSRDVAEHEFEIEESKKNFPSVLQDFEAYKKEFDRALVLSRK